MRNRICYVHNIDTRDTEAEEVLVGVVGETMGKVFAVTGTGSPEVMF